MVTTPYPAARTVSGPVLLHFNERHSQIALGDRTDLAAIPDAKTIEHLVDAAFWISLRREEQYPPRISMAYVSPEQALPALTFQTPLSLNPAVISKIAPGIERPGIHLCVWPINGELCAWGATLNLPTLCFIVETVAPGLLVIKHRHNQRSAKFINVAVLEGDQVKVLNHEFSTFPGCPSILGSLLGGETPSFLPSDSSGALIRLAVSMRDHKRGGTLLVVPPGDFRWMDSIAMPMNYSVTPPYCELSDLLKEEPSDLQLRKWREALSRAVAAVAGLTAIDGATVISKECDVLAFGAKISRAHNGALLESVSLYEPIDGASPRVVPVGQLGGTRHISAAQFAFEQPDSVALVASQDGPFTIFAWSGCDSTLYGYRVESLLL